MFSAFDVFQYFSFFGFLSVFFTLLTFGLFFLRAFLFYKQGILYANQNGNIPRFSDVKYVFFAIGLLGPIVLSFIPLIGFISIFVSLTAFIKLRSQIISLDDSKKITPEKMMFVGAGLGISGVLGFILGVYRGLSDKKEENV